MWQEAVSDTDLSCLLSRETLTEPRTILRYSLNTQTHTETQLQTYKHTDTDRHSDRQTNMQTKRHISTDRQAHRLKPSSQL